MSHLISCLLPTNRKELLKTVATSAVAAVSAIALTKVFGLVKGSLASSKRNSARDARMKEQKKDVVYVHEFIRTQVGDAEISTSSPCARLVWFLKLKNIPFESVKHLDTTVAENEQLPMVEFNGNQYSDSKNIMNILGNIFGVPENSSREVQSKETTIESLCNSISVGWYRSIVVDNHEAYVQMYLTHPKVKEAGIPESLLRHFMGQMRQRTIHNLDATGPGCIPPELFLQNMLEIVKAIEYQIESNYFTSSTEITKADCFLLGEFDKYFLLPESVVSKLAFVAYIRSSAVIKQFYDRVNQKLKVASQQPKATVVNANYK